MAKEKEKVDEVEDEKKKVKVTVISPFSMGGVKYKAGDTLKVVSAKVAQMKGEKLIA